MSKSWGMQHKCQIYSSIMYAAFPLIYAALPLFIALSCITMIHCPYPEQYTMTNVAINHGV